MLASTSQLPTAERALFQDAAVTVTSARVIVVPQNITYAMANITSVREFVEPRPVGVLLIGVLLVALGGLCSIADIHTPAMILTFIGGGFVIIFFAIKPKYWVRIGTAGAETNAIWSHDPRWTRNVVAAVNGAMVSRG